MLEPQGALLRTEDLTVSYRAERGPIHAVREVSFALATRGSLGVVGESGSGKTQVCMAAMGLLPRGARISGSVRFGDAELLGASAADLNRVRGSQVSMVFQDPMTALTPHLRIGVQLAEVLVTHRGSSWRDAEAAALGMLEAVQIGEAARRLRQYPHELSGGMRQRVLIAMSLLCRPRLLIADEPTTALDVTVQAQIIDLLRTLRRDLHLGLILVSHDLGVVAQLVERVVVMYAGRIVEDACAEQLFRAPAHPYTVELLKCAPDIRAPISDRMPSLAGQPPDARSQPVGCAFAPRCARADARCHHERPLLRTLPSQARIACHYPGAP